MATIRHDGQTIEVEVLQTHTSRGEDVHQVQATDDSITLSDQSGEAPWLFEGDVAFAEGESA